ncbi:hypothetical protein P280DRAFT_468729 [Massarina eburnea CBS 473.64]|uniref:Uncharacterized protein n=1 Tax=Massarina eburnea CBS 473.64 TaxID=1395130 RepID=A0A6A6S326_9PLEO|nr:hypothetical protein P280DRAFT_468729 [Massarina eburnea CBS 473.64]
MPLWFVLDAYLSRGVVPALWCASFWIGGGGAVLWNVGIWDFVLARLDGGTTTLVDAYYVWSYWVVLTCNYKVWEAMVSVPAVFLRCPPCPGRRCSLLTSSLLKWRWRNRALSGRKISYFINHLSVFSYPGCKDMRLGTGPLKMLREVQLSTVDDVTAIGYRPACCECMHKKMTQREGYQHGEELPL